MTHGDLCSVKYMSVVNCFVLSRFKGETFLCLGEWKSLSLEFNLKVLKF